MITVRPNSFAVGPAAVGAARDRDELAAAFYGALSAVFPEGEAFFVRSVAEHAGRVDGELAADVRAFVRQEANHSREHAALNRALREAGAPIERLEARAVRQIEIVSGRDGPSRLASTIGLEHFTAVFARRLLRNPQHLAFFDPDTRALWRWHAVEEIDHASVAFDLYMVVTKDWSPVRRWWVRNALMLESTFRLLHVLVANMADILETRGCRLGLRKFLRFTLVSPGIGAAMLPEYLAFALPGFRPAKSSDAILIADAQLATAAP